MNETSTRTVERALALLGEVCDRGSVSLSEAARAVDLPSSTAMRLLRTLESNEHVRRDAQGRYGPGPRIVHLGAMALASQSLVALAEPSMARVVELTGESCYLAVRGAGASAMYVAIVEGTRSVRHANWVGRTIPLDGSAAGAVITGRTGPAGYAVVAHGVEPDVTAIAAPVGVGARVVASLSVVVPSYRVTETVVARTGDLLCAQAGSILARPHHEQGTARAAATEESA